MAKFVDILVDFLSYEAVSSTNSPVDATKIKSEVSETSISELSRIQKSIANGVSDLAIPVPSSSAEYVLIFCDQEVSIKLNGSSDAITLSPQTAGTKVPLFFMKGSITSLTISNGSGSSANLDIILLNV